MKICNIWLLKLDKFTIQREHLQDRNDAGETPGTFLSTCFFQFLKNGLHLQSLIHHQNLRTIIETVNSVPIHLIRTSLSSKDSNIQLRRIERHFWLPGKWGRNELKLSFTFLPQNFWYVSSSPCLTSRFELPLWFASDGAAVNKKVSQTLWF